jgi:hypothetical protein
LNQILALFVDEILNFSASDTKFRAQELRDETRVVALEFFDVIENELFYKFLENS